jgi:hypothetical protein
MGTSPARPWLAALVVLLGHLLLWLWLNGSGGRTAAKPAGQLVSLRLIAERPRPERPIASPPPDAPPRSPARARVLPPPPLDAPNESNAITSPAPTTAIAAASAPALPGSAPPPSSSLLDSEATRRAVRQSARDAPLTARSDLPENAQQRLGREIGEAATGDCLKGEFAGGGMGLLSLPFWALAEARGKCRR